MKFEFVTLLACNSGGQSWSATLEDKIGEAETAVKHNFLEKTKKFKHKVAVS